MSPHHKRFIAIAPVVFLFVAAIVMYSRGTTYLTIETHGNGASVIWHDEEAFIFVGRQVSGKVLKRYQALLESVLRQHIVWPKRLQDDLVIFHLKGTKIDQYDATGFGSGGGAFPFQGRIYFARGGEPEDYPYLWEWNQTNFVRVPKTPALAILETFPAAGGIAHSVTAQITNEGWRDEPSIVFNPAREIRYPIFMAGRSLTLVSTGHSLELEGRLGSGSRDVLSSLGNYRYKAVSEHEYRKLSSRK